MKRTIIISILSFFLIPTFFSADAFDDLNRSTEGWKAGVARVVITPEHSMWLAGYAARNRSSEGILHDLWAKVLVIEDARGERAVLVTTDLLGLPKNLSDRIRNQLEAKFELSRAQIILNSSHTHSGPVLKDAMYDIYPLGPHQLKIIGQYSDKLAGQIVAIVGEAFQSMEPVKIYAQNGVTRFQVNRRNNDESTLSRQTELKGPNDHAVPVIKVVNEAGDLFRFDPREPKIEIVDRITSEPLKKSGMFDQFSYVNSIAIGPYGNVYTLARFEHNGKIIEDLVKIPNPFSKK
ncbi:hypothetical protein ES705_45565 [subsurface metagenome]